MKYFILSLIILSNLLSIEFYAKLEPIQTNEIKSEVSGKVIFSNSKIEGLQSNNTKIIEIDSILDRLE